MKSICFTFAVSALLTVGVGVIPEVSARPMLVQIHIRGLSGLGAGLIQPQSLDTSTGEFVWAKGMHHFLEAGKSQVPYMNQGSQKGPLYFNKFLVYADSIADDLCVVTGARQSGVIRDQYHEAVTLSSSPDTHVPLVYGFNARVSEMHQKNLLSLAVPHDLSALYHGYDFRHGVQAWAPSVANFASYTNVSDVRYEQESGQKKPVDQIFEHHLGEHYATWLQGKPYLTPWWHVRQQLLGFDSRAVVDDFNQEKDYDLAQKQSLRFDKTHWRAWFSEQDANLLLGSHPAMVDNLAATLTLLKLGHFSSVLIDLEYPHQNARAGAADVLQTRDAASLWHGIATFWKEVKSLGLDREVLVMVTTDNSGGYYGHNTFARTRYSAVDLTEPLNRGTGKLFSMALLNGRLAAPCKLGAVLDGFIPAPTKNIAGEPLLGEPAYTQLEVTGRLLMRLFPSYFGDVDTVRRYWPSFTVDKNIPSMVGGI
ncbi:MAG: hypothetical protein OXT67_12235 [Zetaproteobacteria bacterium]|nr:hypothetical protein [Zetaproteobacteria bacterium]